MNPNLNPDEFFHGTSSDISDEVVGGNRIGRSVHALPDRATQYDEHSEWAYSTPDESEAWEFAEMARQSEPSRRPRVYRVQPSEDVHKGPLHRDDVIGGANEYRSTSAKVRDAIWTRPPNPEARHPWRTEPQQGKLPEVAWDEYLSPKWHQEREGWETYPGTDTPTSPYAEITDYIDAHDWSQRKNLG